jgi:TolA-binding protein
MFKKSPGFIFVGMAVIAISGCSLFNGATIKVNKEAESKKVLAKDECLSLEDFIVVVENQVKSSPVKAIWFEQYATDEVRAEIEKVRKEKIQLAQENLRLSQELERLNSLEYSSPADRQKITELQAKIAELQRAQQAAFIGKDQPIIVSPAGLQPIRKRSACTA